VLCSVIPYLSVKDRKLVPYPVVVNAAGLLSNVSPHVLRLQFPSEVQCRYLNDLCSGAGLQFTFQTTTPLLDVAVICTLAMPTPYARELPGKDPFLHAHFIDQRLLGGTASSTSTTTTPIMDNLSAAAASGSVTQPVAITQPAQHTVTSSVPATASSRVCSTASLS